MARNRRSSGSRSYTPKGTKRRGQDTATQESSDSDSDDEEDTNQNKRSRTGRGSNASTQMMPEVCSTRQMTDSAGGDGVSSIQQGSVTNPIDLETLQRMEERIRMMEEKVKTSMVDGGGVSVVSETSVLTRPTDEKIIKENLRKFVAVKVFPSWKFIFKKEQLSLCVVSAVKKGYITMPAGYKLGDLSELYSQTVRASLDGCRANAQTCARKRYLGKWKVTWIVVYLCHCCLISIPRIVMSRIDR